MGYPRTATAEEERAVKEDIQRRRKNVFFQEKKDWPKLPGTNKAIITDYSGWYTDKSKKPVLEGGTWQAHQCHFAKEAAAAGVTRESLLHDPSYEPQESCKTGFCPPGCHPWICPEQGHCFQRSEGQGQAQGQVQGQGHGESRDPCQTGFCPPGCNPSKCPEHGQCYKKGGAGQGQGEGKGGVGQGQGQGQGHREPQEPCKAGFCPAGCKPSTCPEHGQCYNHHSQRKGQGQGQGQPASCKPGFCVQGCHPGVCADRGRCYLKHQQQTGNPDASAAAAAAAAAAEVGDYSRRAGSEETFWPLQNPKKKKVKEDADFPQPALVYRLKRAETLEKKGLPYPFFAPAIDPSPMYRPDKPKAQGKEEKKKV